MAGWKITTQIGHQIQQMHRGADTDMATNRKLARAEYRKISRGDCAINGRCAITLPSFGKL